MICACGKECHPNAKRPTCSDCAVENERKRNNSASMKRYNALQAARPKDPCPCGCGVLVIRRQYRSYASPDCKRIKAKYKPYEPKVAPVPVTPPWEPGSKPNGFRGPDSVSEREPASENCPARSRYIDEILARRRK